MSLTQQQAKALAHFAATLRPDWNAEGIYAALGKCRDRDPFAAALATIRAAWDDGARTPGVIPTDGPHWREMAGETPKPPPTYRPPTKAEECAVHAGQYADSCHGCRADALAGDKTLPPEFRRPDRTSHLARIRAELAAAKANREQAAGEIEESVE